MARKTENDELLRYTFSPEEKQVLSDKLALACQEKFAAEEEKKSAMAGFKKRIDDESANVSHFSRLVNNGWEMRPFACYIDYNTPVHGTKRYTRKDTGEVVKEIAMTAAEYQDTLLFVEDEAKLAEKQRLADLERSVRAFLDPANQPTETLEPIDISEITSFASGDFLIAAVDSESAEAYAKENKLPTLISFVWVDPDTTMFSGLDTLYGDERRSARAAIMHLYKLGRSFPSLLSLPAKVIAEATEDGAAEGAEEVVEICGAKVHGSETPCQRDKGHTGSHSAKPRTTPEPPPAEPAVS